MHSATKRKVREAEKRIERLHYKFISDYVKSLHKDAFDKAEELYGEIRQKYPQGVKDLTKTVEFMKAVTPDRAIPRYYMCRKTLEASTEMVLQIPLIQPSQLTRSTAPLPAEVSQPPAAAAEVSQPPAAAAEVSQPPAAVEALQPVLEEVYQELLKELQKDPDLMRIMDDLPLDVLNDDDMFDAIMPDDITPLEKELWFC